MFGDMMDAPSANNPEIWVTMLKGPLGHGARAGHDSMAKVSVLRDDSICAARSGRRVSATPEGRTAGCSVT